MLKRRIALIATTMLTAITLVGCASGSGGNGAEGSGGEDKDLKLTVYYGTPRDIIKPLFDAFKAEHPNIDVEEFRQPTEDLMSTLELELKANNSRGDVVISAAAQLYALNNAADGKAFEAYKTADAAKITESLRDPKNLVNPLGVNLYGIGYNTDVIPEAEAPKSFADLLDPKWENKIAIADPNQSASIHSFIWYMTQYMDDKGSPYGWDFFKKLGELKPRLEASHGTIRDLVLSGERPIGLLLTEHIPALLADGEPGGWIWPSETMPAEPLGISILANSKNKEAAEIFLDFVHSKKGQMTIAEGWGLMPVRNDVDFAFDDGTKPADLDVVAVDSEYVSKHREEQAEKFHAELGTR